MCRCICGCWLWLYAYVYKKKTKKTGRWVLSGLNVAACAVVLVLVLGGWALCPPPSAILFLFAPCTFRTIYFTEVHKYSKWAQAPLQEKNKRPIRPPSPPPFFLPVQFTLCLDPCTFALQWFVCCNRGVLWHVGAPSVRLPEVQHLYFRVPLSSLVVRKNN
jgi:hypothetical protein